MAAFFFLNVFGVAILRLMARCKIVSYLAQGLARRVNGMADNCRAFSLISFVIVAR